MGDGATFNPNEAALTLFRDLASEMRETNTKVGDMQQTLARMDGQDTPGQVAGLVLLVNGLTARVGTLEGNAQAELARRKPWVFIVQEMTKLVLAGVAAVMGAVWLAQHPHT